MKGKGVTRDDLKFAGAVAAAAVAGLAVFAYMVRRLQFGLLGLPADMLEGSQQSYANAVLGLLTAVVLSGLAVCLPVVGAAHVAVRVPMWRSSSVGATSWLAIAVAAGVTVFVLEIPAFALSDVNGLLWRHGIEKGSAAADILPLVIGGHALARLIASGLALAALALVILVVAAALDRWRQSSGGPIRLVLAGTLLCLAVPAFTVLLAATLPRTGANPNVTIHFRTAATADAATMDAILIGQNETSVFILPTTEGSAPASVISRRSVVRIDYRGAAEPLNEVLCHHLECCTMSIAIYLPFPQWVAVSAALLVVGFGLIMPASGGTQGSSPSGTDKAATATVLSPTLVTQVQSFFPAIEKAAGDAATMVEAYIGMLMRGDGDPVASSLWLYSESAPHQRLTTDGGYRSPRPSRDGARVAFLRNGRPGILDVAAGAVRVVPGDTSYEYLFGWDEAAGLLLAANGDGTLVRLRIADGRAEPLAGPPATSQQLAAMETLARMTPSPGVYLVRENGGTWAVMEKRWGATDNDRKFTRKHPIAEPTWCAAGIVYVGTEE